MLYKWKLNHSDTLCVFSGHSQIYSDRHPLHIHPTFSPRIHVDPIAFGIRFAIHVVVTTITNSSNIRTPTITIIITIIITIAIVFTINILSLSLLAWISLLMYGNVIYGRLFTRDFVTCDIRVIFIAIPLACVGHSISPSQGQRDFTNGGIVLWHSMIKPLNWGKNIKRVRIK